MEAALHPSGTADRMNPQDRQAARLAELEREQAHVSMLYGWLDRLRARTQDRLEQAQRGEGGRTHQAWLDRDALVATHAMRLAQLSAVEHGLCLGRLDHRDGSLLYVGRLGLFDDQHEPLLVDWRAPAAEPFYRATPVARGEVVRRRHFQTRGRLLVEFHDDVLDLDALGAAERSHLAGEAALLASLNSGRTGRMGDIVATIQAEQDRVIRSGLPGILVIEGGPGTGKTAVALHRAAYLLYTHRQRLARRGVLVVGPNPTFLRYIEQVLPSLGETDVMLSTVEELYPGVTAGGSEPPAAATLKGTPRMAAVLAAAVRDRQRVPDGLVEIAVEDGVLLLDPEACALARARARASGQPHNLARRSFVAELLASLARQVADRLEEDLRAVEELIDEEAFGPDEQLHDDPVLDQAQLAELAGELYAAPPVREALDRLWPELTPQQLLVDLFTSPERLALAGLDPSGRALLSRRPPGGAPPADWWTPADVPLLDEAAELLGGDDPAAARAAARRTAQDQRDLSYARGVLEAASIGDAARYAPDTSQLDPAQLVDRYRQRPAEGGVAARARQDRGWTFGHVIVDEAQELSAMAWRMLVRRCPGRSMTVAGDLAQSGTPGTARSWAEALEPYAAGRWREERLTVNYRTPAEIMAVAADVLAVIAPGLPPPTSVRETGVAPWSLRLDPAELAARLPGVVAAEAAAVGDGRVAVLVPAAEAERLGRHLVGAMPGTAVAHGPAALDARVAVLTVTEARGLEFDVVVLVEPASVLAGSPNGANDLYVAVTRATQRLGVVHTTPLPPVLSRLEPLAAVAGQAPSDRSVPPR
jgi:DNA helicase IV